MCIRDRSRAAGPGAAPDAVARRASSPLGPHVERADAGAGPAATSAPGPGPPPPPHAGHSLLHSLGADFGATFQSLPTASLPMPATTSVAESQTASNPDSMAGVVGLPPPSERLLRVMVDSIPVQVFTSAPGTGHITWVNSKMLTYRGQTVDEFLKDPWLTIHPDDRPECEAAWHRALRNGEQFAYRVRIRRFDGQFRWFYTRAAPLRDRRGKTVHWFGSNMDVHDQHMAEIDAARQREVAASEAKYHALANSSPQIVFAATESKGVIFANTQWMSYSGQKHDDVLGLRFTDYVHPDDLANCKLPGFVSPPDGSETSTPPTPERHGSRGDDARGEDSRGEGSSAASSNGSAATEATEATVTDGPRPRDPDAMPPRRRSPTFDGDSVKVSVDHDGRRCYSTELRLRSRHGEYRWHLVRCIVVDSISFGNGDASLFGTCTDINDHKLLEQRLKDAMQLQTRFLSNMSHEIRTPLIGISGMVQFLQLTTLDLQQADYCDTILTSSEGLKHIVDDILDLSKIEAGMMSLSFQWFHVRDTIEKVNDSLSTQAITKGLELNYMVDADVPPTVKGDESRIRQVLMNVLGNAVKFTSTGEVVARCSVARDADAATAADEIMLRFEVIDTGPGFSQEDADRMFKPFSQIDGSNTRQHGGSGLGLVISRQLVELHGGRMTSSSTPGHGSTFAFLAKFTVPDDAGPPASIVPSPATPEAGHAATSPYVTRDFTQSPAPLGETVASPTMASSASSDLSLRSMRTLPSERSSMSSVMPAATSPGGGTVPLTLPRPGLATTPPPTRRGSRRGASEPDPHASSSPAHPRLLSILFVCPRPHALQAISRHIEAALPPDVPHQLSARSDVVGCQRMLGGPNPVLFTHIVLNLPGLDQTLAVMEQIFLTPALAQATIVILADALTRNRIKDEAGARGLTTPERDARVQFLHKPIKPSRVAQVFQPPQPAPPLSVDRSRRTGDGQTDRRRQVFADTEKSVGNQGHRVLLVEDDPTNQKVMGMFLKKVGVSVDIAIDGVQCIEKVFGHDHDYYSLILCDLQMPHKDGYQTCQEIRAWERGHALPRLPIIALSADVIGGVVDRCTEAGFSSYLSKPAEFKALSRIMTRYMGAERAKAA
ncbi:MAG: hypothetical protein M1826_004467 [Phylliscum demangeonii]|nr:MAG: hypothetical protein M1826_004467 [Phylliscum demangeonii]